MIWAPPGDAPATLGFIFGVGRRESKQWCEQDAAAASFSPPQYSGWNLLEDGSIRIEEATEDALGTYTCVPYNALGTMGQSPPARLVLKVMCLCLPCQHVLVSRGGCWGVQGAGTPDWVLGPQTGCCGCEHFTKTCCCVAGRAFLFTDYDYF